MDNKIKALSSLPKVDEVVNDNRIVPFLDVMSREVVVDIIREAISDEREVILKTPAESVFFDIEDFYKKLIERLEKGNINNLRKVINGTGVVLHTNLGRSLLAKEAWENAALIGGSYSTLEYDVEAGHRGSRHDNVEPLICKITGAEAAMVVNNNAAATMLCLSAMGEDREIIVSRGELVEIGGSFRIPEIMKRSGADLVEVGTTNKTKIDDYRQAITENTAAIMKVHTSNFKIMGFTEDVDLPELVELGAEKDLPVIFDLGSGLIHSLREEAGIEEPAVIDSLKTGIDVILFSGDKLLGGPQAGIIAGKKKYIDMMKRHQLARVVRIDKMTLAALESTLRIYLDKDEYLKKIPTLRMIVQSRDEMKEKAEILKGKVEERTKVFRPSIISTKDQVGGGSAPAVLLDGMGLLLESDFSANRIEELLREGDIPVIVRIVNDSILIEMRTVDYEDMDIIADRLLEVEGEL